MEVRKIQSQPVYGAPSKRVYYRLRLPRDMARQYVKECGENRHIWAESADTLCVGGERDGSMQIRILGVRELRKGRAVFRHFWQILFPQAFTGNMRGGDEVEITRDNDTIRLKFGRDVFVEHDQAETADAHVQPGHENP